MRLRFRAHIAFFLLLTCVVHVFPVKWLHECKESTEETAILLTDLAADMPTLSSLHLKCNLCDFQVPPFIRISSDWRIELPSFSDDFHALLAPAPDLPLLYGLAPRAPPIA